MKINISLNFLACLFLYISTLDHPHVHKKGQGENEISGAKVKQNRLQVKVFLLYFFINFLF